MVSSHSHVSFHHFAGVLCSVIEVLQVGLHLTQCAPHPQQVDVSVSQNRLGSVYGVPADFHHLNRRWKRNYFKVMLITMSLNWILSAFQGANTLPHGSRRLIEPCPSSPTFENSNLLPLSPAPLTAENQR